MESYYKITEVSKSKDEYFKFYINLLNGEENKNYINNIFKVPKLPLIGSKNKNLDENNNSHLLGKLLSLVCFQIDICQGKQNNEIEQLFTDFTLPENIKEYLNIDEVIEIDNNTDEPEKSLFFMPKKKLNFYFIISELPYYEEYINDNINEYIDFYDNKNDNKININNDDDNNNINKINFINDKDKNNYNKFDIIDDFEENNDNDYIIFNIIPHFFYLNDKEKDLLEVKNLSFQEQITLFTLDYREYNDIDKKNNKNFIDINNLRAETSNIILVNNKFKINPNNLKFYLNISKDMSQFYLIYTTYENDYHSVFYYITCNNNETKNKIINILNISQTLKDLINGIENNFGNNDVIKNLKELFF